ncbi:thiamine phosphate synthase [Pseudoxanthomonas sp.]|uniref:thiamine phosphate synthase n=1 Tax=Pseudoxanthomonas sp. TaxID=1871049 RepID=UPI00260C51CB|nr:thiamine phosphate synthase [Pseudoxanthomonas sp.]WDS35764.1 MAG: thiamine phosphate synthase [Pseudoxanthomonas sp.]
MSTTTPPRGLYLITPDDADGDTLLACTAPLLASGAVTWLQYRNKRVDAPARARDAAALQALSAIHGVPLIINDDVPLALAIGAAGVHLEEDPTPVTDARTALGPQALLGASCYEQPALARQAVADGASYVSFGAFFPSTSKPTTHRATPDVLIQSATLGVPRVAIGGLTPGNAAPVIQAGADLVAVIGGIYRAPDPIAAARAFQALFA